MASSFRGLRKTQCGNLSPRSGRQHKAPCVSTGNASQDAQPANAGDRDRDYMLYRCLRQLDSFFRPPRAHARGFMLTPSSMAYKTKIFSSKTPICEHAESVSTLMTRKFSMNFPFLEFQCNCLFLIHIRQEQLKERWGILASLLQPEGT